MTATIRTINAGSHCFLVQAEGGFVLIDTGVAYKRTAVERELEKAGCGAGDLRLIVLTHGDSDHADNAAFLRKKYGAPIAMHPNDAGMVRRGDMSHSRKAKPDRITAMGRVIMLVGRLMTLVTPGSFDCFSPDVYLEDGQSLSEYGFDARVLHLPAHSQGSIGVLTPRGRAVLRGLHLQLLQAKPSPGGQSGRSERRRRAAEDSGRTQGAPRAW
jgi:hydroxyacylglutathione hydrolase